METIIDRHGHSTREVADLAGISYRQLDYWCRIGMLTPSLRDANGSGSRRRYSDDDVALAMAVGRQIRRGFRLDEAFEQAVIAMGYRALLLARHPLDDEHTSEIELVTRALRFTAGDDTIESFDHLERARMLAIADRLEEIE